MNRRRFDFEEEENILIEKATKRKQEEQQKKINNEKNYTLRKNVMGRYFQRMSSFDKEKLILRLLDNFNDVNNILEFAHFITLGDAKPYIYTSVYYSTNFLYDKFLLDHNRCLNEKELKQTIDNDIKWYKSLNADEQIDVIISLIKHSGGNIQMNLFIPILKKCFHKKKFPNLVAESIQTEPEQDSESNKVRYYESRDTIIFFDHPATIEVENHRRNWNQIISKYRDMVEGPKPTSAKEKGKNVTESKKKDDKDDGSLDWIQLLPIWDVKKIFSYFDQKTLQKLKNVNAYWSFVVQEVTKEKKMRIQLDKEIENLENEIGPKILAEDLEEERMREESLKRVPKEKKRFVNLERGAIVKKLVPKPTDTMVEMSINADVMNEIVGDYFTEHLVSFPRELDRDATTYKYQPCFLRDVHVAVGDQEDIQEQKSFVTYTLDTQSDRSITLPVDRQTLEEW